MNELLQHLPAIYREGLPIEGKPSQSHFLAIFLRAFERVLLDGGEDFPSLEQQIERLPLIFQAESTPIEFLDWLADWVALTLHPHISLGRRRKVLGRIASLYRIRGTKEYLEKLLQLHLEVLPSVSDTDLPGLQIAGHSTIGVDTYLGGGPPFLFQVTLAFAHRDPAFVKEQSRIARTVIEIQKPAHTWYKMTVIFPRFHVGVHSTVGVDTVFAARK